MKSAINTRLDKRGRPGGDGVPYENHTRKCHILVKTSQKREEGQEILFTLAKSVL